MSVQAFFLRQLIRRSVKTPAIMGAIKNNALPVHRTVAGLRSVMEQFLEAFATTPDFVNVEDVDAGGVPSEWVSVASSDREAVLLYLHGGAYLIGSADTHRGLAWRLAAKAHCRVLMIDYRLAPEHPFPAPVDDAFAAYCWLLDQGFDPDRIGISGDSAGGGLALALLAKLRDEGKPMPAAAFCISPWTDLAATGPSMKTNAKADPMFDPGAVPRAADIYLNGENPYHPYASPLYADPTGFPPVLIHVGSTEILLDDARRMAHNLRMAGVECELDVWADMPHVWHVFGAALPEARAATAKGAAFLENHMAEGAPRRTAEIRELPSAKKAPQRSRGPRRHAVAKA